MHRGRNSFEAGKSRIVDDEVGGLQPWVHSVRNEFSAEHAQVRIGFVSMGNVAVRAILRVGLRVEGIGGGVNTDKAEAVSNGTEQRLLAFSRDWRIFVGAWGREISSREEQDSSMLAEIYCIKDPAILGSRHLKTMFRA